MTSTPAIQDTCTLSESVLSMLIGLGRIDETNTFALRTYAAKAKEMFGIEPADFYTELYIFAEDEGDYEDLENYVGDWELLDYRVEKLVGDVTAK